MSAQASDQAGLQLIREIKRLGGRGETDYRMLRESPPVDPIHILERWNPNVNVKDEDKMTALHWALALDIRNRKKIIELLLDKGADVNTKTDDGEMPLHSAIRTSKIDIVELLLAKGADVNATDQNGQTPLHLAARYATLDILKLLMTKNPDVNVKDRNGRTPLDIAIEDSKVATVEYLFSIPGIVMSPTDSEGRGVIERARPAMRRAIQKAQYKSFDEATNQKLPTDILGMMKRYGGKKTRVRKIKRRKTRRSQRFSFQ